MVSFKFRPLYSQGPNTSSPQLNAAITFRKTRRQSVLHVVNSAQIARQSCCRSSAQTAGLSVVSVTHRTEERRGAGQKQHGSLCTKIIRMMMTTKAHYRRGQIPIKRCFICNNFSTFGTKQFVEESPQGHCGPSLGFHR